MPHRRHRRHLPEHHHRYEHPGIKHSGRGYHGFDDYDIRREYEDGNEYEDDDDYEYSDEPLDWEYEDRNHYAGPAHHQRLRRLQRDYYADYSRPRDYEQGRGRSYGSNFSPVDYSRIHRAEYPRPHRYPEDIHGDMRHYREDYGSSRGDYHRQREDYTGYGPKNWTRPDQRISEEINERLTADRWLNARDIDVIVKNGEVTLSGNVNSRQAKRQAEDIAECINGVKQVQNDLRIAASEGHDASEKSRSSSKSR